MNPEAVMFVLDAHSEFAPSSGHLEKSKPLPKLWHSEEGPGFIHILPPISDGNCKVIILKLCVLYYYLFSGRMTCVLPTNEIEVVSVCVFIEWV